MMRVILFLFTNLSVMILFGSIISILGCFSFGNSIKLIFIAGIVGLGGSFFSLLLSKSIALSVVRGVIVTQTSNNLESWLLKIMREQSTRLNIITPKLAIYNSHDMNAFATGMRKNSALIAVSSGLLEKMSQDSIEAVIAHEMSHIVSGDMVTMTLIQGVLNTFVIFLSRSLASLVDYWVSLIHHENDEKEIVNDDNFYVGYINSSVVYILISSVLELFFGVIASIVVFWFSRYREFYADAGAAKLVGRKKMIDALRELKCDCESEMMNNSSVLTFFISNPIYNKKVTSLFYNLFASHPSLNKRIKALQCGLYLKSFHFF